VQPLTNMQPTGAFTTHQYRSEAPNGGTTIPAFRTLSRVLRQLADEGRLVMRSIRRLYGDGTPGNTNTTVCLTPELASRWLSDLEV
jgi:hypothetical protein